MRIILCIILLLPFSLYADVDSEEKVGEPYFNFKSGEGKVDSAVLAPTGNRLYTLKNGILNQYNLNPLKRIHSQKVEFDSRQNPDDPYHFYRIFITEDEKRIVIYNKQSIRLLDLESGKLIKTISLKSELGILNGEEFLTLDNNNTGIIWEAADLSRKKEFKVIGDDRWSVDREEAGASTNISHANLIKAGNYIILYDKAGPAIGHVTIFDRMSYEIKCKVIHFDSTYSAISYDFKTLYVPRTRRVQYETIWDKRKYGHYSGVQKIDLLTGQKSSVSEGKYKQTFRLNIPLSRHGANQQISPTGKYYIVAYKTLIGFHYPEKRLGIVKRLIQFEDGEAALLGHTNKHFQITANARKHLKMKNSKGEIRPINDITFEKYSKEGMHHTRW